MMILARKGGLRTAIMRLSNVYGRTQDHPDRVVPAFARAAVLGHAMQVCGRGHTFDFTHVDDVICGILKLVQALENGSDDLPSIHFVSSRPTTLGRLAAIANDAGGGASKIIEAEQRDVDVSHFVGDPSRAFDMLQWRAQIRIEDGVARLVRDFERHLVPDTLRHSATGPAPLTAAG